VITGFDRVQVERFKHATEEKLRGVLCPEHHRPPRIRFHGSSLREISISLSGCCPKVMELANARIGGSGIRTTAAAEALPPPAPERAPVEN
jgi:hypothetical protein